MALVLLFGLHLPLLAQKRAVTETGQTVILYDDGTWSYEGEEPEDEELVIPTNPTPFFKSPKATFGIESEIIPPENIHQPQRVVVHEGRQ